ncbi:putative glucuronosyltransferase [Rosa chinensis]|uniref:Putative glucuronosyltransferase n=1 Tax=Rosa chinensis TaxID=74649 RepID=A0A2P6RA24_ROSCH|nr:beta-glucuronosyltransferase GlcAT14C [Rosa chinensis]PRQ43288.1 putative glucuronosyltransferase [Rosa chinensis]
MKRTSHNQPQWLVILTATSALLLLALLALTTTHAKYSSSSSSGPDFTYDHRRFPNPDQYFVDSDDDDENYGLGLPRFAYLITGSEGDGPQLKRLLQAAYHPRNYYLLHLDLEASDAERLELAKYVKSESVMNAFRNAMVVGTADLVTAKGPTVLAATLHAVAILLKRAEDWDWFINLSASDYPLMSQDDLLHIFSYLPRDLNFLEHTSNIGWKENQRARPIIIDPGLYHTKKSGVFWAKERRSLPASFKLFMGSTGVVLTRSFLEFCVLGWDNLPRTLLMYYTNFLSSTEGYFHTVICNHKDYQNTTVNHDLHYIRWDSPPKLNPVHLTLEHYKDIIQAGAPFASPFVRDDPVLDKIDKELLRRPSGHVTPGGWCLGSTGKDRCSVYGNPVAVKPTVVSKRLEKLIVKLLDSENFRSKQCK